ncbi:hypothetical protein X767_14620 [Mesorhizobium sp. LSJC264A00]|nr:hypothetical protein X767_14620 [Mesorhizobium sp. LSJC264A00]
MLRQLQTSADRAKVLHPLRIACDGSTTQRGLHLIAEVLDERVQQVTALLPQTGLAHPLGFQFTRPSEHRDEQAAHVLWGLGATLDLRKQLDRNLGRLDDPAEGTEPQRPVSPADRIAWQARFDAGDALGLGVGQIAGRSDACGTPLTEGQGPHSGGS